MNRTARMLSVCLTFALLLCALPAGADDGAALPTGSGLQVITEYRPFVYSNGILRHKKVSLYDNVYAFNHTEYVITPFDAKVPSEYFIVDDQGGLALSTTVLDITDATRQVLYGGDVGKVAMYFGQYCEDARSRTVREWVDKEGEDHRKVIKKFAPSGIHEGLDFIAKPGQKLHAVMDGVVRRAGGDKDNTVAIYNESYDVTLLYLHADKLQVKVNQQVKVGDVIGQESNKGSGSPYTHFEMRQGKWKGASPYRNATLTSMCPYELLQKVLGVTPSGREPITAAAVYAEEQRRLAEEAQAAAQRRAEEEAAAKAAAEAAATPTPEPTPVVTPTPVPTPEPTLAPETPENFGFSEETAQP